MKRGLPHREVVDREQQAHAAQFVQLFARPVPEIERGLLGDFQTDVLALEGTLLVQFPTELDETRGGDGPAGHVDREFDVRTELGKDRGTFGKRLFDHRLLEAGENVRLGRQFDDQRRIEDPVDRMFPAEQRFDADAATVVVVLRLIVEGHVAGKPVAQVGAERFRHVAVDVVEIGHALVLQILFVFAEEVHEHREMLAAVALRLTVEQAHERIVDRDADQDQHQLQKQSADPARLVAAEQDRRRPVDRVRDVRNDPGIDGEIGHRIAGERHRQEGDQHNGVEHDRKPEDHQFVDVEDHRERRRQPEPPLGAVAREGEQSNEQADGRAATAHQNEAVEELLAQDRAVFQSVLEVGVHHALERVAAVHAEEPEDRRHQNEEEALEEAGVLPAGGEERVHRADIERVDRLRVRNM